jgi:Uma2 family endonuclease
MLPLMSQLPRPADLMTADAFIEWAMLQPSGRYELVRGAVVAMAPERAGHSRVKTEVLLALRSALIGAGLECEAFADGMAVRIDDGTVYEPDALIRCGPRLPNEAVHLDDPVVVVEVISPSSRSIDTGTKLTDYFRLPSVRHYLVVQADAHRVTHHHRTDDGGIYTRILVDAGVLRLDPPGVDVSVADFFATA